MYITCALKARVGHHTGDHLVKFKDHGTGQWINEEIACIDPKLRHSGPLKTQITFHNKRDLILVMYMCRERKGTESEVTRVVQVVQ